MGCVPRLGLRCIPRRTSSRGDAETLVTETVGAFGFDERILSSVIDARARLLTPDAIIIPRRLDLYLVPVDDRSIYERSVAWWTTKPYGFDLSALAVFAANIIFV